MKIYGIGLSNYVILTRATAAQLGLAVEHVDVRPGVSADEAPEFRKASPSGRVPGFVDGDLYLNESHAICRYLCSQKPGDFYPEAPQSRALVDQWMCFAIAHWTRGWQPLQYENFVKGLLGFGSPDAAIVAAGTEAFHSHAGLINSQLAVRPWLAGNHMTLADFAVAAGLVHHQPAQHPVAGYASMRDWYGRVAATPAWQQALPK